MHVPKQSLADEFEDTRCMEKNRAFNAGMCLVKTSPEAIDTNLFIYINKYIYIFLF